ncbi:MAG TPA: hypothetical protein VGH20_13580 [Myxococcales bacterium]
MRKVCAAALILLAGCGRCGADNQSAKSADELLPAQVSAAVVTAPLGGFMQHAAALSDRAAALPGGEQLADLHKGVAARLGFDPFTREGLLSAGIDPDRGAAVALLPNAQVVTALPLSKPDLFLQTAQRFLADRAGYAPSAGHPQVFERRGAQLGLSVVRGYGILARGADAGALLAQVSQRKPEQSLAKNAGFVAMRQKFGGQDLLLHAPAGSDMAARFGWQLPGEAALALTSSVQGIAVRLLAQLPPEDAAKGQAALPGGGSWLVGLLPQDAPVRARLGVSAPQLLSLVQRVPQVAEILAKIDPTELFASLAPGAALSLGVEKTASLAHLVDYGLDIRKQSPFQTVQLVALAQVADEERFNRALGKLIEELPSVGAKVTRTEGDFQITYSGGKGARFGVREIEGKKVAYVIGGSLDPKDLKRGAPDKNPEAAALIEDPGAAGRADFGKLYDAIHALPSDTYGSGPQSYVTRSLVGQVVDPLRPLRVSIGVLAHPDSIGATLDVEIAAQ